MKENTTKRKTSEEREKRKKKREQYREKKTDKEKRDEGVLKMLKASVGVNILKKKKQTEREGKNKTEGRI
jgi:hypothetical protein